MTPARLSNPALRLIILALGTLALAACGINSVPTKQEAAKAAWANVQTALSRRAALIPNLVATVQGAAGSETQILTNVTEARARATSINVTTDDLSDPATFQRFNAAQNQLTQALGQLRTVVENYPQLQSQGRFTDLMTALEGSENRLEVARTRYNEAVQDYNTTIRTFPDAIGAKVVHGAQPMQPYEASAADQAVPTVDFGTMATPGAQPGAAPAAGPANDNASPSMPGAAAN